MRNTYTEENGLVKYGKNLGRHVYSDAILITTHRRLKRWGISHQLPNYGDRIRLKVPVCTHHGYPLDNRLCDDEPVKGITVMQRKFGIRGQMRDGYRQYFNPVYHQLLWDERPERRW